MSPRELFSSILTLGPLGLSVVVATDLMELVFAKFVEQVVVPRFFALGKMLKWEKCSTLSLELILLDG